MPRRVLKGYGRMTGIPDEWMIELSEDGLTFAHVDSDAAAAGGRDEREDGRREELRAAILGVLPADDPDGLTREEIWAALPEKVRVNEVRFRQLLEAEAGKAWRKEGAGNKAGAYRYRRHPLTLHTGPDEGGKE
ncbi:MAG: hypothetical protein ABGY75_15400 [Gemmataceae bacterium]